MKTLKDMFCFWRLFFLPMFFLIPPCSIAFAAATLDEEIVDGYPSDWETKSETFRSPTIEDQQRANRNLSPRSRNRIINGAKVTQEEMSGYKTILYMYRDTSGFPEVPCTATMIGNAVVLTAAHCVEHGAQYGFMVDGVAVNGACYQHDSFDSACFNNDLAVCVLKHRVENLEGGFETLSMRESDLPDNEPVNFAGFGCTDFNENGNVVEKALYQGTSKIKKTGRCGCFSPEPDRCYQRVKDRICTNSVAEQSDVSTTGTNAILCEGDSGGPVFQLKSDGSRKILGVASMSTKKQGHSIFATVYSNDAKLFLKKIQTRHGVQICGLTPSPEAECK